MAKSNYGIDSPGIVAAQASLSAASFVVAALFPHAFGLPTRWIGLVAGLFFLQGAVGMLHYSLAGKMRIRDRLLDLIPWRGDEVVLDVGCGRGLLLVGAAHRLTSGKATGVDVWVRGAVTGNSQEAVLENAALEGVSERVEVKEGDARQLPFADGTFDVIISNFVLHELKTGADRERMVREMVRVLKPGGQFALADFIFTSQCIQVMQNTGMLGIKRLRVGRFSFWVSAILSLGSFQLGFVSATKSTSTSFTQETYKNEGFKVDFSVKP